MNELELLSRFAGDILTFCERYALETVHSSGGSPNEDTPIKSDGRDVLWDKPRIYDVGRGTEQKEEENRELHEIFWTT